MKIKRNIQLSQNSFFAWIIVLSSALLFFFESIRANMFDTLSASMMRYYQIHAFQLGKLSALYLLANVIFLIPAGIMIDCFSTKRILIIASVFCAIGSLLLTLSHQLYVAEMAFFIAGIGCAFSFISAMHLASRWFSQSRLALITTAIVTMAMVGGLIAQTPLRLLLSHTQWKIAPLLLTIFEAILPFYFWLVLKDSPHPKKSKILNKHYIKIFIQQFIQAILRYQNWFSGFFTSALNLAITVLGALWGELFLIQARHFNKTTASDITALLFIGIIFGAPFFGWLSDRTQNRKGWMIFGAITSAIIALMIIYLKMPSIMVMSILFLALGFFSSVQSLGYTLVAENNKSAVTGSAMSLAAVLVMLGGTVFQPLFGWVLDLSWNKLILFGVPLYSPKAYQDAMLILPIAFLIAAILVSTIKLKGKL